ncbi:MAG: hypothetical protein MUD14_05615 [Hydrococcus sp. Prado102]|jgi:hypothetical protein|nr:hypothetical protein [Hydrococcus sp. Prado102]
MESFLLLEQAAKSAITNLSPKPSPDDLVNALLCVEKNSKRDKKSYSLEQLVGTWQLCFITGTKKTRERAGIVLGSGRYLSSWVKIYLSYSCDRENGSLETPSYESGTVENLVELGSLKLALSGPVKFLSPKNILAFDFTRMTVRLFGIQLYQGYIRGGKTSEEKFYAERVSKQAFFAYFFVGNRCIAARGRGGGLALWGRP